MTKLPQQINDSGLVRWMCDVVVSGFDLCLVDVTAQMLLLKCIYMIFWNKLSQKCFVSLLKNNLSPSSWAPKARSEAWEVYPWELYPPDDPPRPSRTKAGFGPSALNKPTTQIVCLEWGEWTHPIKKTLAHLPSITENFGCCKLAEHGFLCIFYGDGIFFTLKCLLGILEWVFGIWEYIYGNRE